MKRVGGVLWRGVFLAVVVLPLAAVPLGILWVGGVTFGADRGWWAGNPTWNGGGGSWGLAVGATLTMFALALGAGLAAHLTKDRRQDLPWILLVVVCLPVVAWMALNARHG